MNSNLIAYFSAYGHTRIAAETVAEQLEKNGFSACTIKIPDPVLEKADEFNHIFFLTPVYHKNVPQIWDKVLTLLPEANNTAVFLCIMQGKDKKAALPAEVLFKCILHPKGYKVLDTTALPSPEMTEEKNIREFTTQRQGFTPPVKLKEWTENISSRIRSGKIDRSLYDMNANIPKEPLLSKLARRIAFISAKTPQVSPDKCKLCGICQAQCPIAAIAIDTKVHIGSECIKCYVCKAVCPEHAIL
ncbi:MAG: EFR1 family ferrodoxin [Spirochaetia bacterium]